MQTKTMKGVRVGRKAAARVLTIAAAGLALQLGGEIATGGALSASAFAQDAQKAKFYDFSDQVIDGEIKKPSTLFTDARQKVKFKRLNSLKKSLLPAMLDSSKENTFK